MRVKMSVLLAGVIGVFSGATVHADREWEESTSHYEDDAWYDISEWFDGNDYNPTDEEWNEWDDETFHESDEVEGPSDNDTYGFDRTSANDDWFYDYYDDGDYSVYDYDDNVTSYDAGSRFFDYDNDGFYDGYSTFFDWDQDGLYDDYNYYYFGESGSNNQQQARSQAPTESRKHQLTGEIKNIKRVQVRNGYNMVVAVEDRGMEAFIDLGSADKLKKFDLKKGDRITVSGHKAKVGDKQTIVATALQSGSQKTEINRDRKEIEGKVVSTHKTTVRGKEHLIAMVNTPERQGKVAVDLGPASKLYLKLEEGSGITFRGVPVKVKNRKMLLAMHVQDERGQWQEIQRRDAKERKDK